MPSPASVAAPIAGTGITAETVVGTISALPQSGGGGEGYRLRGVVQIPNVAAAAVVTVKVRQVGVAGTVVGTAGPYTVGTAAVGAVVPFDFIDGTAALESTAATTYVVTVTSTTSTGAGVTGAFGVEDVNSQF